MSHHSGSDKRVLSIASFLSMLITGLAITSLAPLLVPISDFFHLETAQAVFPVLFNSLGFFSASIIVSFVWRIHRARSLLTFSSLFLLMSLVGIIFLHTNIEIILVLLFFIGLSCGLLNPSISSLFSEISGSNRVKYLNLSMVFFGIGAFIGPLLVGVILNYNLPWYMIYVFLAIITLPFPLVFWRKGLYKNALFSRKKEKSFIRHSKNPGTSPLFWSITLTRLILMGMQISFSSWIPLFLTSVRGFSPALASYSIAIFWLSMIGGRLFYIRFFHNSELSRSLIIGAFGATLFATLSFLMVNWTLILLFIACSGLILSFMSPGILALGGNIFPNSIGFVTGVLMAVTGMGGILFPWLVGITSQKASIATGVFLIPVFSLGVTGILIHFRYYLTNKGS